MPPPPRTAVGGALVVGIDADDQPAAGGVEAGAEADRVLAFVEDDGQAPVNTTSGAGPLERVRNVLTSGRVRRASSATRRSAGSGEASSTVVLANSAIASARADSCCGPLALLLSFTPSSLPWCGQVRRTLDPSAWSGPMVRTLLCVGHRHGTVCPGARRLPLRS